MTFWIKVLEDRSFDKQLPQLIKGLFSAKSYEYRFFHSFDTHLKFELCIFRLFRRIFIISYTTTPNNLIISLLSWS